MDRHSLDERQRILHSKNDQRNDRIDNWDDGELDDKSYKDGRTRSGLEPSRVPQSASNKVPEEFAVEQGKEAAPDRISARCDANIARIFVPDKISH